MDFAYIWIDLESITISEMSQKERNRHRMITLICGTLKKIVRDECPRTVEMRTRRAGPWLEACHNGVGGSVVRTEKRPLSQ